MSRLIKNWKELSKVPPNDRYKIIIDKDMCSGWVVPICDEQNEEDGFKCNCSENIQNETIKFFDEHVYLSTHTFYGLNFKKSTRVLQEHGFDIEIDNWDKKGEINDSSEL